jgi:hypothetical protein
MLIGVAPPKASPPLKNTRCEPVDDAGDVTRRSGSESASTSKSSDCAESSEKRGEAANGCAVSSKAS